MANPLQAASTRRKVIYIVVIVALFTVTLFWRGKISMPLSGPDQPLAWLGQKTVINQATALELRELDQGDPELVGQAAQVALTGTRGIAVTILWRAAIEKQKRGEFHEMETYARLVTRLQPNFPVPWIFQSWNLAYNVSVENERLNDMYFYISRGIELLAEGERLNKMSPDMRFQTAFYYQNKFSVSDKVTTLRSLMQVSTIPPPERNPSRFLKADNTINPKEFEEFCRKNPQLVRRLREKLDCRRPEQVVQFLADNEKIPSLYLANSATKKEPEAQFPVLPPFFEQGPDEYHAGSQNFDDRFDAFHAARAWYSYAQTVVPPSPKDPNTNQPIPAGIITLTKAERFKYRIPRSPALIIFRQTPARAQSYLAERLAKEGWYDAQSIWKPDEFRDPSSYWFKRGDLEADLSFKANDNSQAQWAKAFQMWDQLGRENALIMTPTRQLELQRIAGNVPEDTAVLQWNEDIATQQGYTMDQVMARKALISFEQNRHVTNFDFFLNSSEAESDSVTVQARKLFGDAAIQESQGNYDQALNLYIRGLAEWRKVLIKHEKFHHNDRSDRTEEETYELIMKAVDLIAKEFDRPDKRKLLTSKYEVTTAAFGGIYAVAAKADLDRAYAEDEVNMRITALDERVANRVDEEFTRFDAVASTLASSSQSTKQSGRSSSVRMALARQIVDREFPWLKIASEPGRNDRDWVAPPLREQIRGRMGLVHKLPAEQPPETEEVNGRPPMRKQPEIAAPPIK
ncbi:MAG: hypothetical protein U0798_21000 [Gemmataceae bacterium]